MKRGKTTGSEYRVLDQSRPNLLSDERRKLSVSTAERAVDCSTKTTNGYLIGLTYDTSIIYEYDVNDARIQIFFYAHLCTWKSEKDVDTESILYEMDFVFANKMGRRLAKF